MREGNLKPTNEGGQENKGESHKKVAVQDRFEEKGA